MPHLAFSQTLTLAQMFWKMQAEACCCPSCHLCRRGRPASQQVTGPAQQCSRHTDARSALCRHQDICHAACLTF